jgi:hypothetical protein
MSAGSQPGHRTHLTTKVIYDAAGLMASWMFYNLRLSLILFSYCYGIIQAQCQTGGV